MPLDPLPKEMLIDVLEPTLPLAPLPGRPSLAGAAALAPTTLGAPAPVDSVPARFEAAEEGAVPETTPDQVSPPAW